MTVQKVVELLAVYHFHVCPQKVEKDETIVLNSTPETEIREVPESKGNLETPLDL